MFKNKIQLLIFIFLILISFQNIHAQLSKKHYLPPITSDDPIENQYIYISTPKNQNIGFKIIPIGQPETSIIIGTVSNTTSYETSSTAVGTQLFQSSNSTSVITSNKGYIIEADDVIYVSVRMRSLNGFQAGAIVSKGISALGTNFRMGGFSNNSPANGHLNFISVMATEDDTNVNFDDISAGITINNYTQIGITPINIILDEGETYIVSVSVDGDGDPNDLIGTLVNSDKPIVVNSGSATGSFADGNGRDYGVDQIVDASKVGTEYIFVRGDGNDGWENALIVAHLDSTEIKVAGNIIQTLNKGEFHVIEGGFYNFNGNMFVETSKPAFAYQGIGGLNGGAPSQANQGMFFVPPLSCENRGDVNNIAKIDAIGGDTFQGGITIVTNKDADVTINGLPIANFNNSGPFDVDGNPNYETYRVSNLTGNVTVKSSEELYCAYFNYDGFATSGSFYSGFPSAPEINFTSNIQSLGDCVPNLTLDAANTDLFDSFDWLFDDETGTGFISIGITTSNFSPTLPGKYKLVGFISCSGLTFESAEVPVSLCPDDFDGDAIIDNLDVDIDNDGILNCDESLGNATLNLLDINTPSIIFQDNTSTTTITTPSYTENESTNSFTGNNIGNFVSIINPAVDSKLKYELKFNQNINFKLAQDKDFDHTISDGEFFILKISPNSKNITLLDPDDQLLIDTNFDGEFEPGITSISASEIWYTYKSNTSGAASTFQFLANQVNQIDFKHQSAALSTTSTFKGNIQLTCFRLDSDGDGIENMFDLDSDNDGIPDVNEAFPQPSSLSGVDANLDGLDDMFDGVLNVDSDNDGILNYLDLDSDNDGIFDATEAGHNLDTDFDGIVDNANALVGVNGLVDNLETTPDTKALSLNYDISNTDNDLDFDFVELDADNDTCFDVTEAGFTDVNNDGIIDANPFIVNDTGKVNNTTDGYTYPNLDYITSAPIELNTSFNDVIFCENSTDIITIDSNADTFKWEISTDNATWNPVTDNAVYDGSSTNSLQIKNPSLAYHNYKFRVILNRIGNACPKTSNEITLTVNPLPIPKENPTNLKQCDSDPDKKTTFNLTLVEKNISDNPTDRFEYYTKEADAITGAPEVSDKTSYFVDTTGEAWVKIISEYGCSAVSKINLSVSYAANELYDETFAECDDLLPTDGITGPNYDTDGITFFDLSSTPNKISIDPDIIVELYETEEDRTKSLNEIRERLTILGGDLSKYRNNKIPNTTGNEFPIFYKRISKSNNDCQGIGEFYLQINETPKTSSNKLSPIKECDTGLYDSNIKNGSNKNIDLTQKIDELFNGTGQNKNDFEVTFYTSETAAFSGDISSTEYISTPDQFKNDVPTTFVIGDVVMQPIYVRIENKDTGCSNPHTSFEVIINPLPQIINPLPNLAVCDMGSKDGDTRNGLAQNIKLSERDTDILTALEYLDNKVPSDFVITYHKTEVELDDLSATGVTKDSYDSDPTRASINTSTKISEEVLFIRIIDNTTDCIFKRASLAIIVNPQPTYEPISELLECDNNLIDADDTNESIPNIDFDEKIPEILGTFQDPKDYTVTFHSSPADASTGAAPILSPYTNTNPRETIYVRIQNKTTFCVNADASFDLVINALPDFDVTSPQIFCLNNPPLNIIIDYATATYDYEWRDPSGAIIMMPHSASDLRGGAYSVTATTTDGTNCNKTKSVLVTESNIAILKSSFVSVIDEASALGNGDNLSIIIDIANNNLGPGDYQFALLKEGKETLRIPSIGFQTSPVFEYLEGGIYTIIVNDKNGCTPDATLKVSVLSFPKFFTPNGDNNNDTWTIKGATKDFYINSSIHIFNRYGKLIAQVNLDSTGWDGTYKGKGLSSDDYWYNIILIPADTSKPSINKIGNFSLLRK